MTKSALRCVPSAALLKHSFSASRASMYRRYRLTASPTAPQVHMHKSRLRQGHDTCRSCSLSSSAISRMRAMSAWHRCSRRNYLLWSALSGCRERFLAPDPPLTVSHRCSRFAQGAAVACSVPPHAPSSRRPLGTKSLAGTVLIVNAEGFQGSDCPNVREVSFVPGL